MTTINVQLTMDDYLVANRLHMWSRGRYMFVVFAVIAAFVVYQMYESYRSSSGEPVDAIYIGSLIAAAIACFAAMAGLWFVLVNYVVLPRNARRIFGQQKSLQAPFEISWDDEGLTTVTRRGTHSYPWSDFFTWRMNAKMFLVYVSERMFLMVPRRCFADAGEAGAFEKLLREKIAPKPGQTRKS